MENENEAKKEVDALEKAIRVRLILILGGGLLISSIIVSLVLWDLSKRPEGADAFPPGQLVRHRMDGRLGVVLKANHDGLNVRFSCNYTAKSNFETFCCQPFELVPLTKEDEENLYWRRRERPPHSRDQTELP